MKPWLKKTLFAVLGMLTLLVAVTAARQQRRFEAPFPDIRASTDPAVIERGRYIVEGAGHCSDCHGSQAKRTDGSPVTLSGGREYKLPIGVVRIPNITPDRETGIGRYSDREIARILRYGVRPDGTALLPFMPFTDLSDTDLTALISYLRTQTPVVHEVAPHERNLLGRIAYAYLVEPVGPSAPLRRSVPAAPTPEYGRYLANSVANCAGCHTARDLRTGAFTGPRFAGGGVFESKTDPKRTFVTPNLTPDKRWG